MKDLVVSIERGGVMIPVGRIRGEDPAGGRDKALYGMIQRQAAAAVLDGIPGKKRGRGAVICLLDRRLYLRENLVALPLEYL